MLGFAAGNWRKLPPELVLHIKSLTGVDVAKQYNLDHLYKEYPDKPFKRQAFVWVVGRPYESGTVYGNGNSKVVTLKVLSSEVFMQGNWNRGKSSVDASGQLDPSVSVLNTDVFSFTFNSNDTDSEGRKRKLPSKQFSSDAAVEYSSPSAGAVFGPIYKWDCQYLAELPPHALKHLYDERDPATGRAIGDNLVVHPTSDARPLTAISKIPDNSVQVGLKMVMAGEKSDIPVCVGMGVRFNGSALDVPELATMAGIVSSTSNGHGQALLTVFLVLPRGQLPSPGNGWNRLDATATFQTNVMLQVRPEDVIDRYLGLPTGLWQYKQHDPAAGSAFDLHVVGHIDLVPGDSPQLEVTQKSPRNILQGLYGYGPLAGNVQWHLYRVATLDARRALKMAAVDLPCLFGSVQRNIFPYVDFIRQRLLEFARGKPVLSRTSTADNTLHLLVDGWVFVRVLHEYLDMNSCTVSQDNSVFFVTAQTWEAAQMFLPQGQPNGAFDLRKYGYGFVELFAPIVFKWEIYDTSRGRADSRSPDGFVAITFSGYEERDRHNNAGGIKDTREHPQTRSQMYKRPSACPRY